MSPINTVPFDLPGFAIDQVKTEGNELSIRAHSTASRAHCPLCGQSSTSVHTYYSRSPRDLPCNGRRVRLVLDVRRFRCQNETCPRKTFAERISQIVPVHGQRTARLTTLLEAISFEVTAEASARITQHLNVPMSADTLLCIMRHLPDEPVPTPRVLGVDDWAFKKGAALWHDPG